MLHIQEAIVVEGRYDKNTLSQVVDTLILETGGFQIFKDPEKMALLRRAAERRGLIVLTDSDGGGHPGPIFEARLHPRHLRQGAPEAPAREGGQAGGGGDGPSYTGGCPPSGGGGFFEGGCPGTPKQPAYYESGLVCRRPVRGAGQHGQASGPPEAAGPARAHVRQRPAGCPQRLLQPGGGGGDIERCVGAACGRPSSLCTLCCQAVFCLSFSANRTKSQGIKKRRNQRNGMEIDR